MFHSTRSSREGKPSAAGSLHVRCGRPLASFVAVGDSFTEGLNDDRRSDGRYRGWADRVADGLMMRQGLDDFTYANLAIRGRLMAQVREEQVAVAASLRPDLVSFAAGVNDSLRRNFDLNFIATDLEMSVRTLREAGSEVLLFAYGDPSRRSGALARLAQRTRALRSVTLEIARIYDCFVVDFWGVATYDDDRLWSSDRLHLSALGHRITAQAVLDTLGWGDAGWRTPLSSPVRVGAVRRRTQDAAWLGAHAGPWLARRIRRTSSGIGIEPKDPTLRRLTRGGD